MTAPLYGNCAPCDVCGTAPRAQSPAAVTNANVQERIFFSAPIETRRGAANRWRRSKYTSGRFGWQPINIIHYNNDPRIVPSRNPSPMMASRFFVFLLIPPHPFCQFKDHSWIVLCHLCEPHESVNVD